MDEQRTAYLIGLKSFFSNKTQKDYYVARVLLKDTSKNAKKLGCFDYVDIFVESEVYNKLWAGFKQFQVVPVVADVGIDRVYWKIAS